MIRTAYNFYQKFSRSFRRIIYFAISLMPKKIKSRVAFTYASEKKNDGLGAQIQRIVAIKALTNRLGSKYHHCGISQLTVHPLDNIANTSEYESFLNRINYTFYSESDVDRNWASTVLFRQSLTLTFLFRSILKSWVLKRNTLIRVVEPYGIMELIPSDYLSVLPSFVNFPRSETKHDEIVMHYRYGVGGSVVQPGEKIPRQLNLSYFKETIRRIQRDSNHQINSLMIVTDAPVKDLVFTPRPDQRYLWEGTPGFKDGRVDIKAFPFDSELGDLELPISLESGGDALNSIFKMSSAKYLILSRSSLSYVGAIFNGSFERIISAPDFWHPKMKSWD